MKRSTTHAVIYNRGGVDSFFYLKQSFQHHGCLLIDTQCRLSQGVDEVGREGGQVGVGGAGCVRGEGDGDDAAVRPLVVSLGRLGFDYSVIEDAGVGLDCPNFRSLPDVFPWLWWPTGT